MVLTAKEADFRVRLVKKTENLVQITITEEAARQYVEMQRLGHEMFDRFHPPHLVDEFNTLVGGTAEYSIGPVGTAIRNALKQLDNNRKNGSKANR